MEMKEMLKDIGKRISNIGALVDTNPDNDPVDTDSNNGTSAFGGGIKGIGNFKFNSKDAASAATEAAAIASTAASAVSDKNLKDIDKNDTTEDVIERAYKGLDDIIYKYNQKGQALGEDDKLRAGVTAQSLQGSILESNVFTDPETGFLKVDTAQQTLANSAAIKVLFEKIDELEKLIKK